MDIFIKLFSGIGTFFIEDPKIAIARILLIILGFILAWMGFRRTLEPLIMVPMGLGMIAVNAGVLFLAGGQTGTLILDPMVSDPVELGFQRLTGGAAGQGEGVQGSVAQDPTGISYSIQ